MLIIEYGTQLVSVGSGDKTDKHIAMWMATVHSQLHDQAVVQT
jgi:hypothetical protein